MNIFFYLRLLLIAFIILLIILQHYIFSTALNNIFFPLLSGLVGSVLNTKVRVHGNTDAFNNSNLLVMANHYDGFSDANLLYNLYCKHNSINHMHAIVKADFLGNSDEKIYKIFNFLNGAILDSLWLIPYKRGDKNDGALVKNKIKESLDSGKNILIYPEGVAHRNGIPVAFKQGIFDLAVEQKMNILPITMKYNRDIGAEKWEPPNTAMLLDNELDIYIHDIIRCETDDCYKANDPVALKHKVFNIISEPMLA
jgi:1-acyl-sn-glycerol-3-phosphate acyltransferase